MISDYSNIRPTLNTGSSSIIAYQNHLLKIVCLGKKILQQLPSPVDYVLITIYNVLRRTTHCLGKIVNWFYVPTSLFLNLIKLILLILS